LKILDREKKPEAEPTVKVDSEHAFYRLIPFS
jgi:hypothetical protein